MLNQIVKSGESIKVEERLIFSGRAADFMFQKVPLCNYEQKIVGILGISIDITEKKAMERKMLAAKEEAETANKLKTDFIYNMQHDIRTPFSGLYAFSLILAEQETDPQKKQYLEDLHASAKELMDYCDGILDFSCIEEGIVPASEQVFVLSELLDSMVAMEKPAAMAKSITLRVDYDHSAPQIISADGYRIKRILINLVSNAIKFTDTGGVVVGVASKASKNHVGVDQLMLKISITDTGVGIAADQQEIIYHRFARLTKSNKGNYKGFGLGLSIVKKFVEELHGEIHLTSEPGKGSTFMLQLPVKVAQLEEGDIEPERNSKEYKMNSKKVKLLLVEDNELCQIAARIILSTFPCEIDVAVTGEQALEQFNQMQYDLILMDLGLPAAAGFTVSQLMREVERKSKTFVTPIVALTAHDGQLIHVFLCKVECAVCHDFGCCCRF